MKTELPNAALPLNSGLTGHLNLVCGLDSRGVSSIRRQSFRAPIHLSKPHADAGAIIVNLVNPTAGLLAGDRVDSSVEVQNGARLVLTTPSANRVHCMPAGWATVVQQFSVASEGSLENWPEILIPQSGARYRQITSIDVAEGGELMFWELLAPGRVASGETFQFRALDWSTQVRYADRPALRERYRVVPGEASVAVWRDRYPEGYYASGILFLPALDSASGLWRAIHELHSTGVSVGVSTIAQGGWAIRILAQDSVLLRKTLGEMRRLIYEALRRPMPSLRRAGG